MQRDGSARTHREQGLAVPHTISDVTPDWLGAALHDAFAGIAVHGFHPRRIGEGFGLSSEIYRVELRGPATPDSVVLKLWDTNGVAGTREVRFFEAFGPAAVPHVPACHFGAIDATAHRGALIFEDLRNVTQGDCLDQIALPRARRLARTLAVLHAKWWESPEVLHADWLPSALHEERGPDWYADRRATFLQRFPDLLPERALRLLQHIEEAQARARARFDATPRTLVHFDMHLDNVLFDNATDTPFILDWARVARGPAALDLADVTFAIGRPGDADAIMHTYLDALRDGGIDALNDETLRFHMGAALLLKFSTSTCGVARWQPSSAREERMIEVGVERAVRAVDAWRAREPELFAF